MRYTLMHKTKPVLRMEIDELSGAIIAVDNAYAPEHLPVGIPCTDGEVDRAALLEWWTGRAIPASRAGLRDALEALKVPSPLLLLTKCYGLSLSDQYWVCPNDPPHEACGLRGGPGGSDLHWEDINFFDNEFSRDVGIILFGGRRNEKGIGLISPDSTSDGWLRKRWEIIDGKRCLVKGGSGSTRQEPYNEVFASALMRRLGVAHAPYSLKMLDGYPYSVCETFVTSRTELVSAWRISQVLTQGKRMSNLQHFLNCCEQVGLDIPGVRDSINKMLTIDFLIVNEDRHFNNFGAIRNADTLEWIGMAPVFDCGTSMWHSQPVAMIYPAGKQICKPFRSNHAEQIKLVSSFDWLNLSALRGIDEELREILNGSAFIEPARRDALCYGLRKRVEMLEAVMRGEPQRQRGRER